MPTYHRPLIATPESQYSFSKPNYNDVAQFNFNLSQEVGDQAEIVAKENDMAQQQGIPANLLHEIDNNSINRYANISVLDASLKKMIANNPRSAAYVRKNVPAWENVAEIKPISEEAMRPGFEYVSPYEALRRTKVAHVDEAKRLQERVAVMSYLSMYPDDWRDTTDDDLRNMLNAAKKETGIDTSDWDMSEFRRYGLEWKNVDLEGALNLFGVRDIQNLIGNVYDQERYKDLDLSKVNENSPLDQILYKERLLRKEYEKTRGTTVALDAVNTAIASIPWWVELGMTGPIAGINGITPTKLIEQTLKAPYKHWRLAGPKVIAHAVGKGLGYAGLGAVKRIPYYLPKNVAEAYNNYYTNGSVTIPIGDGEIMMEVPESRVAYFWQGLVTSVLMQTTETFSEELGAFLPDITAPIRNRIVTRLAWNPVTRKTTREALQGIVPYHGIIGEMFEEHAANFMDRFWTIVLEEAGMAEENTPGTETWVLHGREHAVTAGSILLQSIPFYLLGLPGSIGTLNHAKRAKGFVDNAAREREAFAKTGLPDTNLNEARFTKDELSQGDIAVVLTPEMAESVYNKFVLPDTPDGENNQQALANIGITQESIQKAKNEGRNVIVSYNQTQTVGAAKATYRNADAIADAVIKNSATMAVSKNMEELSSEKATKEELDRLHDEYTKSAKFKQNLDKKYDKQIDALPLNGIAKRASKEILRSITGKLTRIANDRGRDFIAEAVENFYIDLVKNPEEAIRNRTAHHIEVERRAAENRLKAAELRYKEARDDFQEEDDAWKLAQKEDPTKVVVPQSWTDAHDAFVAAQKEIADARANIDHVNTVIADLENPVKRNESEDGEGLYQLAGVKAAQRLDAEEGTTERMDNYAMAQIMDDAGVDPVTIWAKTGWNKQKDGNFVFETPDLKVNEEELGASRSTIFVKKLEDFAIADDIFRAYPELKDYNIQFVPMKDPNDAGYHDDLRHVIAFNTNFFWNDGLSELRQSLDLNVKEAAAKRLAKALRPTLIHEVQHAIQAIEDFAPGSNVDAAAQIKNEEDPALIRRKEEAEKLMQDTNKMEEEVFEWFAENIEYSNAMDGTIIAAFEGEKGLEKMEDLFDNGMKDIKGAEHTLDLIREVNQNLSRVEMLMDELQKESTAFRKYQRTAGEVQSRNASFREGLSDKSRREIPPSETEDVPREDQILLQSDQNTTQSNQIQIPGFYSNFLKALQEAPQEKMTPAQWMAYLQKVGGLKASEMEWRGSLEDFFKGRDPKVSVTRQELLDAFEDSFVELREIGGLSDRRAYDTLQDEKRGWKQKDELLSESQIEHRLYDLKKQHSEHTTDAWRKRGAIDSMMADIKDILQAFFTRDNYTNYTPESIYNAASEFLNYFRGEQLNNIADKYMDEDIRINQKKKFLDEAKRLANEKLQKRERRDAEFPKIKDMKGKGIRKRYTTSGLTNQREIVIYSPEISPMDPNDEVHFGRDTGGRAIVWVRFGETTDKNGQRVLVIDEIQSNRHQLGREQGYKESYPVSATSFYLSEFYQGRDETGSEFVLDIGTTGNDLSVTVNEETLEITDSSNEDLIGMTVGEAFGPVAGDRIAERLLEENLYQTFDLPTSIVPPAPFEKNWQELGMKRMIRYAAANGYDKVAWTSGEQQAKRYNIGNVISEVNVRNRTSRGAALEMPYTNMYGSLNITVDTDGNIIDSNHATFFDHTVMEVFGKELGSRVMKLVAEEGEPRTVYLDNVRLVQKYLDHWVVEFNGEEELTLDVYSDGDIIQNENGKMLVGTTLNEVFGDEVAKRVAELMRRGEEGASFTLEEEGHFKMRVDSIKLDKDTVIGGEGMKTFYDKILKNFTEKYIKKWGSKVGVVELPNVEEAGREMWGFDVTDKMKEDVLTKGQPLFQLNGQGPRGKIDLKSFEDSHMAIVTLFQNSDASTLPHESAHWLYTMMKYMVENDLVNETGKQEFAQVEAWLDRQDYSADKVAPSAIMRDDAGNVIIDEETGKPKVDMAVARQEYFAEAFEKYLKDGVLPETAPSGLRAILRRLARMLMDIYQNAKETNAVIDDSIRAFFDSMFAADYLSEQDSMLADILRQINADTLALTNAEMNDLERDIQDAKKDSLERAWFEAFKAHRRGVLDRRPIWKAEAETAYSNDKAEKARNHVAKNPLNYGVLRWVMGMSADALKGLRGLVTGRISKSAFLGVKTEAEQGVNTTSNVEPTPATAEPVAPPAEAVAIKNEEDFKSAAEDAQISLPENEDILAALVYGEIWDRIKGGILKKINEAKASINGFDAKNAISDTQYKVYLTAKENLSGAKNIILATLYRAGYNNAIDLIRKAQVRTGQSLDETISGTDDLSLLDLIPDTGDEGASEQTKNEARDHLAKYAEGLEGTKKQVAQTVIKMLLDGAEIDKLKRGDAYKAFQESGGKLSVDRFGKYLKEVKKDIRGIGAELFQEPVSESSQANPVEILQTAQELGYDSVDDLINALRMSKGHDRFVREFMEDREAEYNEAFLMNPKWNSEAGAVEYLDAILNALKLTKGVKFSQRKKNAELEAVRKMQNEKSVGEILKNFRAIEIKMRTDADKILKALKSKKREEKAAAITAALDLHATKAQLHAARELQADIQKLTKQAKRIAKSRRGDVIDGDCLSAIKAFMKYFGFSEANPDFRPAENAPGTVMGVLREIAEKTARPNETPEQALAREMMFWSPWMNNIVEKIGTGENGGIDFTKLTMAQFNEVAAMIDYLNGKGREFVSKDKASFTQKVLDILDKVIPRVLERKGWHINNSREEKLLIEKVSHLVRTTNATKSLPFAASAIDGNSEFSDKREIGPYRRYVEIPVSKGASTYLFLKDKYYTAIKAPLDKLMASCKSRGLTATNRNENTKGGSYTTIRNEQMAFILLNSGNVEGRQRLMSGFGWSEQELNSILKQFSEEDYKNAEAIWKSLSELGKRIADEFYKQRHYRMKMVDTVPIALTNYEGKQIVSDGGYYPIGYSFVVKKQGTTNIDPSTYDILTPMQKSVNVMPTNMGDPGATITRQKEFEGALLLDSSVVLRSVNENAYFIGLAEPLKVANAVAKDPEFRKAIEERLGKEFVRSFDLLMLKANRIYDKKAESRFVRMIGARMATLALGYKLTTILKQAGSLLVGVDRLGGTFSASYQKFISEPVKFVRDVCDKSPFMRDRFNLRDRDLAVLDEEYKSGRLKAEAMFRRVGYAAMKYHDLCVAAVQWDAAYNHAYTEFLTEMSKGASLKQDEIEEIKGLARGYADDFVAMSQGGARDIDIPAVQMDQVMKILTPFCGPAIAAFNTRAANIDAAFQGKMSLSNGIKAIIYNLVFPAVWNGLVMSLKAGLLYTAFGGGDDDDEERAKIAFWQAALSEPLSGIPLVQDVNEAMVRMLLNPRGSAVNGIFDVSALRPVEDAVRDVNGIMHNWDNPWYVMYLSASALGELYGMPAIQVIEDWEKWVKNNSAYDTTIKQQLKERGE